MNAPAEEKQRIDMPVVQQVSWAGNSTDTFVVIECNVKFFGEFHYSLTVVRRQKFVELLNVDSFSYSHGGLTP